MQVVCTEYTTLINMLCVLMKCCRIRSVIQSAAFLKGMNSPVIFNVTLQFYTHIPQFHHQHIENTKTFMCRQLTR